jgi:hypothetical protein
VKCLQEQDSGQWRIEFNSSEAFLVSHSLQQLAAHYRLRVEDLPEVLQDYWRGRISKAGDPDDLKEASHQLEEERIAWRGERLPLVEKWVAEYEKCDVTETWALALHRDELETLMIILNDRRLTLAAEHDLSEGMMEMDLDEVTDEILRHALLEVHILGNVQGILLDCVARSDNNEAV